MFKKIFKKEVEKNKDNNNILIAALLIHSAKIDDNYTDSEKDIIKKAIIKLNLASPDKVNVLLDEAEKKENEANQIVEFTKEIKKKPMEYRLKVIEILWKIVYSDGTNDSYESNLIRRVCGLLYVSDKESGDIKIKVKKLVK
tara:strand:+ start:2369 stop:2794 length:426 start_codon:yes stop_codon:yes gene_type:complete